MNQKRLFALFAALLMMLFLQGCGKTIDTHDAAAALAIFNETEAAPETTGQVLTDTTEEAAAQETEVYEEAYEPDAEYEGEEGNAEMYEEDQEAEDEYQEEFGENVCYISISCETILNNYERCNSDKWELVPDDGVILRETAVEFTPGESVFDVLQRVCRASGIHMESEYTPMYNSAYIEGIHNLYEFDVGDESGWMYRVNGWFPNYGCSRYEVENGDNIQWMYTCDLGADIGGANALG